MASGLNPENQPHPANYPPVQPEIVGTGRSAAGGQPYYPQIIIQQPGGRRLRFVSWLGWVGLALCVPVMLALFAGHREYFDTTGGIQEKYHSLSQQATDKVAVVQIDGIIMDGDGFVKRQIDRIRDDDSVKAVVVHVDSPGGTVTGSDYLFHHLRKLRSEKRIPLVVSMGGLAASGGYYVAMAVGDQERSIFAEGTTTTGSIGVIIPHYDISGLLARYDIKNDSIASHPHKQLLSITKAMTPEERAILQQYVDESFVRFKEVIGMGRPKFREKPADLDQLATGRIFTAQQAKQNGLIDEIGFVEDAIARAIELAHLSADNVRVVTFKQTPSLLDLFGFGQARANPWDQLRMELSMELGTPRHTI